MSTFHDSVKITGKLTVKKFSADNTLLEEIEIPNLVVTAGKNHIAQRIITNSETIMSHMAIGSGLTTPAAANTTLVTELAREALTTTTVSTSNVTYTATFGAGVGTGSVTEAAIFNASSSGTMLCRTTFPVITKSSSETIAISWTVSVG